MQPDQAKIILEFLLSSLDKEVQTTHKVIAAVPVDQGGYKPDARSMSAFELCWHIATAETFFATAITAGAFPPYGGAVPESIKTSQDVLRWYDEQTMTNLQKLKALTGEQCVKVLESPIGTRPAICFLETLIKHTVHHRGQLSAYLRPMGAKVPSIYGSSLDDKQTKTTAA